MSDPNITPERAPVPPAGGPRGPRNIIWIVVAILVVVAVVWYVMQGDTTPPPAEPPATTEAPAVIDTAPADDVVPAETAPAETMPAETVDEPADTEAETPAEGETPTN